MCVLLDGQSVPLLTAEHLQPFLKKGQICAEGREGQHHICCQPAPSSAGATVILSPQQIQVETLVVFIEETETLQSARVGFCCVKGRTQRLLKVNTNRPFTGVQQRSGVIISADAAF